MGLLKDVLVAGTFVVGAVAVLFPEPSTTLGGILILAAAGLDDAIDEVA